MHSNGKTSFLLEGLKQEMSQQRELEFQRMMMLNDSLAQRGPLSPVSQTLRKKKEIYKKTRFLIGRMFPDHERRVRLLMARTC